MKYVVALAALLCAAPATPQEPPKWTDAIPPARFQSPGFVPVLYVPPEMIEQACGMNPPEGKVVIACTRWINTGGKDVRIVIMPDPCSYALQDPYAAVQCHENAHYLTNWKHETQ